jgi:ribonuclease HII
MASSDEIEAQGIVAGLALAGSRALDQLLAESALRSDLANSGVQIILDGSHNWLGPKAMGIPVVTKTKADRDCVSVAAASVLAKVTRDRLMIELEETYPGYGLASNKGYASASHIAGLKEKGVSPIHRTSWLSKII